MPSADDSERPALECPPATRVALGGLEMAGTRPNREAANPQLHHGCDRRPRPDRGGCGTSVRIHRLDTDQNGPRASQCLDVAFDVAEPY